MFMKKILIAAVLGLFCAARTTATAQVIVVRPVHRVAVVAPPPPARVVVVARPVPPPRVVIVIPRPVVRVYARL